MSDPNDPLKGTREGLKDLREARRLRMEGHLAFLEQWRTDLQPILDDLSLFNRIGADFALGGIKAVFILNGGALIALPAFAGVFRWGSSANADLLTWAVGFFVGGLILSAAAYLLGYLVVNAEARRSQELLNWRSRSVREYYHPPKDAQESAQIISGAKKLEGKWGRIAFWLMISTIIVAVGALVSFIVGAFFGWQMFSQGQPQIPDWTSYLPAI